MAPGARAQAESRGQPLRRFVALRGPSELADQSEQERLFTALLDRAKALCEERLAEDPDDLEATYLLGSTYGLRASFEVTVNHDTRGALSDAKEAWRLEKLVVTADPRYYDAYLTIGVYEYVTGSLPFYLRWIASLAGFRGSKSDGIVKIEAAARSGRTSWRDAKTVLSVIYAREERFEEALKLLRELAIAAPHNHVLRLNAAYCLSQLGRYPEAAESYAEALRVARPHARFRRADVRVLEARARLFGADPERAIGIARAVLEDLTLEEDVTTRARLVLAQALDSSGRREEALVQWQELARAKNVDGSKAMAKRALRTPWSVPAGKPR